MGSFSACSRTMLLASCIKAAGKRSKEKTYQSKSDLPDKPVPESNDSTGYFVGTSVQVDTQSIRSPRFTAERKGKNLLGILVRSGRVLPRIDPKPTPSEITWGIVEDIKHEKNPSWCQIPGTSSFAYPVGWNFHVEY